MGWEVRVDPVTGTVVHVVGDRQERPVFPMSIDATPLEPIPDLPAMADADRDVAGRLRELVS